MQKDLLAHEKQNILTSQLFTYSHAIDANAPLGQLERAYYLSYFLKCRHGYNVCSHIYAFSLSLPSPRRNGK